MTTSGPSNADLFHAEDGLLALREMRKAVGLPTTDIESAYWVLAEEMFERDLLCKGLPEEAKPGVNAPADDDGDNDDQEGAANNTGKGVAANSEDRGKASDGAGSEKQTPRAKAPQVDGPVVRKEESPPNAGKHPDEDDGLHTDDGVESGKGGEENRTQRTQGGTVGSSGDPKNPGHSWIKPGGRAAQNKSPDGGNRTVAKATPTTPTSPAKPAAASPSDPDGDGDNDSGSGGDNDGDYTPHPFAPSDAIPSICATCGRAIADHVGKFLGSDDSWEYASFVIKEFHQELGSGGVDPSKTVLLKRDFTDDERRQFAGNGVSLPDGSFPIPDEASLHNAIRLVGHAHDPQAAMQHIIERSKTMGMTHALPPAWNVPDAGSETPDAGPKPGAHGMSPQDAAPKPGGAGQSRPTASKPKPAAGPASPPPSPSPSSPSVSKAIAEAFDIGFSKGLDTATMLEVIEVSTAPTFHQYAVIKSSESRITMGPVYMPDQYDAHDEWTTAEELEKSLHRYVAATGADRYVYLQHTDRPAGRWLEVMQWPFPVNATMTKSVDGVTKSQDIAFPAGTVYMKVNWEPWSWEMVKAEQITGFSMGGWAKRVEAEIGRRAA